jgi:hypothetical protein
LQPAADRSLGNSVGAIGWPAIPAGAPARVLSAPGVERFGLLVRALLLVLTNFCRSSGGGWSGPG